MSSPALISLADTRKPSADRRAPEGDEDNFGGSLRHAPQLERWEFVPHYAFSECPPERPPEVAPKQHPLENGVTRQLEFHQQLSYGAFVRPFVDLDARQHQRRVRQVRLNMCLASRTGAMGTSVQGCRSEDSIHR